MLELPHCAIYYNNLSRAPRKVTAVSAFIDLFAGIGGIRMGFEANGEVRLYQ